MAETLGRWVEIVPEEISDGDLILAWANLGSLVEGTLKLFLCVYLRDFKADDANTQKTQAFHKQKQLLLDPDGLHMNVLRGGLVYLHSLAGSLSGLPIAVMPLREAAGGCIADRVFACQGWNAA